MGEDDVPVKIGIPEFWISDEDVYKSIIKKQNTEGGTWLEAKFHGPNCHAKRTARPSFQCGSDGEPCS